MSQFGKIQLFGQCFSVAMRSKRRLNRSRNDSRNRSEYSNLRRMAALLQSERQQHQAIVAELRTILDKERTEVNGFLKEMQQILIDIERRWPIDGTSSAASSASINNRHVSIKFNQFRFINVE